MLFEDCTLAQNLHGILQLALPGLSGSILSPNMISPGGRSGTMSFPSPATRLSAETLRTPVLLDDDGVLSLPLLAGDLPRARAVANRNRGSLKLAPERLAPERLPLERFTPHKP
jgi:hypothetical protein